MQDLLDEWLISVWQNRAHDGLRDPLHPQRTFSPNQKYAALIEAVTGDAESWRQALAEDSWSRHLTALDGWRKFTAAESRPPQLPDARRWAAMPEAEQELFDEQARQSPVPAPRKPLPPRTSRLEPFKPLIRDMVQADPDGRRTVTSIMRTLVTDDGMTGISCSTIRGYVISLRGTSRQPRRTTSDTVTSTFSPVPAQRSPAMTWSPAHSAVELEDLPRLRGLLDAGHDVEDDDGHGWTLLRHAIDVEHDAHVQTGRPLHADVTAFLLARGADPLRPFNGISVIAEAETRGHWLAAEIMRAWTRRGSQPARQGEGSR